MRIVYPQLDGVKINENRTLPFAILQAIRKAYEYLAQLAAQSTSSAVVIEDLHANREILHPAANLAIGSWYVETDRSEALYVVQEVSSANAWVLVHGSISGLLAARPADLTANDVGFFYHATNSLDYLWSGAAWVATGWVRGGSSLTNVGAIPKVSAAGTVAESALTDNGTRVTSTEPITIAVTPSGTTQPQVLLDAGITGKGRITCINATNPRVDQLANVSFDGANWNLDDTGLGAIASSLGTTFGWLLRVFTAGANPRSPTTLMSGDITTNRVGVLNGAPGYELDVTGDINASGVFRKAGTAGATGTINLAKLTAGGANGTITVTGGIITAFTNPT